MSSETKPKRDVEELAADLGIDPVVLAGAMEQRRWKPGRSVTERDLRAAVAQFLARAAG